MSHIPSLRLAHVKVRVSAVIASPMDQVWPLVRHFGGQWRWTPRTPSGEAVFSELCAGYAEGQVGAVRQMTLGESGRFFEQLTALDDGEHLLKYKCISHPQSLNPFPAAFLNATGSYRLTEVTLDNATFVDWHSEFDTDGPMADDMKRTMQAKMEAGLQLLAQALAAQAADAADSAVSQRMRASGSSDAAPIGAYPSAGAGASGQPPSGPPDLSRASPQSAAGSVGHRSSAATEAVAASIATAQQQYVSQQYVQALAQQQATVQLQAALLAAQNQATIQQQAHNAQQAQHAQQAAQVAQLQQAYQAAAALQASAALAGAGYGMTAGYGQGGAYSAAAPATTYSGYMQQGSASHWPAGAAGMLGYAAAGQPNAATAGCPSPPPATAAAAFYGVQQVTAGIAIPSGSGTEAGGMAALPSQSLGGVSQGSSYLTVGSPMYGAGAQRAAQPGLSDSLGSLGSEPHASWPPPGVAGLPGAGNDGRGVSLGVAPDVAAGDAVAALRAHLMSLSQ